MHLPELEHSRRTSDDSERGKTERATDRGGPDKSVTITPASRYLTDRRYTARKPLFSTEQYASILKKTQTQTVKVRRMERERLSVNGIACSELFYICCVFVNRHLTCRSHVNHSSSPSKSDSKAFPARFTTSDIQYMSPVTCLGE